MRDYNDFIGVIRRADVAFQPVFLYKFIEYSLNIQHELLKATGGLQTASIWTTEADSKGGRQRKDRSIVGATAAAAEGCREGALAVADEVECHRPVAL